MMHNINKNFVYCENYKVDNFINKPLFFYHIPKCGGTTLSVILSHLFKQSIRLKGPLFENNDKGGMTAFSYFKKNKTDILKSIKYSNNFIHGHVPIDIHSDFIKNYFFITIIRDPIERTISHYKWCIFRKYISKDDDFESLFKKKKLPSNVMTNMFLTSENLANKKEYLNLAINNITKNINVIVDIKQINYFIKDIISYYNFPSLLFQSQQITPEVDHIFNNKITDIIKKYNDLDIQFYKEIIKKKYNHKKIFFSNEKNKQLRKNDNYLYSSPGLLLDGNKNIILNKKQVNITINKLLENNFKITSV